MLASDHLAPQPPAWVAPYVGLPYAEHGRGPEGYDCWGLVTHVWAEHYGRALPSYEGPRWHKGASHGEVAAAAARFSERFLIIPGGQEQEGDGILLRLQGFPVHIGLVVARGWMLHVERGADSVLERYDGLTWGPRRVGVYRHR